MVKPAIVKASKVETTRNATDTDLKFKGVRKRKWGKWVSEIRLPNSRDRIWLGSYDSAEKAARAFDAAQVCLRGPSARLNFPGTSLPIPEVPLTHEEVQTIAARFANSEAQASEVSLAGCVSEESSVRSDTDSPSESVSGMSNQLEDSITDPGSSNSLMDFLPELEHSGLESYYKQLDYGIFPGFDDLTDKYCDHTLSLIEFGEDKLVDDFLDDEFFLWNY